MGQNTTPIFERAVYAQDTQPNDTRDGVIWVDTSKSPRETFVYSTDSGSWESVAPPVRVTEPTEYRAQNFNTTYTNTDNAVEKHVVTCRTGEGESYQIHVEVGGVVRHDIQGTVESLFPDETGGVQAVFHVPPGEEYRVIDDPNGNGIGPISVTEWEVQPLK